jgi:hypothetical protein
MGIPGCGGLYHGLDDLVDIRKPASFEGQATQLLPPGLNQVQPTAICRDEPQRDLRPGDQCRLRLPRHMGTPMIGDQYPLAGGIGLQDLLQELHEAGAVPPRAAPRRGQSGSRLEGTQHPDTPPAAVVGGKGRSARAFFPNLARVGLRADRPQFIEADNAPVGDRRCIGPEDGPYWR